MLYPIVFNIVLSLFKWNGISPHIFKNYIGVGNYKSVLVDAMFWKAFTNTFYFVSTTLVIQNAIGLLIALVIFLGGFRLHNAIRSIIFFPTILSPVLVALIWKKIFISDGLINTLFHIEVAWLGGLYFGIWIVAFINIWQWSGYNMVLYYAGLLSIDPQLIEAATIDGAPIVSIVMRILLPILKPTIAIASILTILGGFKVFDLVYVMTGGGPAHQSEVITTYMYWLSFDATGPNKMGYASTVVIILLLIAMVFGIIRIRVDKKRKII
jgi:raffinose/stachyose/melibiose transport system permease protein